MLTENLLAWLINLLTDVNPKYFAIAVLIAGPAELSCGDAVWWSRDPYRVWCYCQAAKELGVIEERIDLCDLERANGTDFDRTVFEMRWSHARLTKRMDGR